MAEATIPEKAAVRRSFERAAARYDAGAFLQREIGNRLLEHLDPVRIEPARIVDLGSGTGGFFHALSPRYPRAQLVAIDLALNILPLARGRTAWERAPM